MKRVKLEGNRELSGDTKVEIIRAIRMTSGIDLKSAKELTDDLHDNKMIVLPIMADRAAGSIEEGLQLLQSLGVRQVDTTYVAKLKAIIEEAVEEGDWHAARILIETADQLSVVGN